MLVGMSVYMWGKVGKALTGGLKGSFWGSSGGDEEGILIDLP